MPLVTNEQQEKRPSQFLKLSDKSKLTIFSNLYKIPAHFLRSRSTSVLCIGSERCYFCKLGHKPRYEYYYLGDVDGNTGTVQVPSSVFFALNEQERVLDIDKRDSVWVISKSGSGKQTRYSVARGREVEAITVPVEEANSKLSTICDKHLAKLEQRYNELAKEGIQLGAEDQEVSEE